MGGRATRPFASGQALARRPGGMLRHSHRYAEGHGLGLGIRTRSAERGPGKLIGLAVGVTFPPRIPAQFHHRGSTLVLVSCPAVAASNPHPASRAEIAVFRASAAVTA